MHMNNSDGSSLNGDRLVYDYTDSYVFEFRDKNNAVGIIQIAELFIQPGPKWVERLFALRNMIASLFKLKTSIDAVDKPDSQLWEPGAQAGIFKVFEIKPNEIILGEDDKHLDFRVSLLITQDGQRKIVTVTTMVKYHNALGRCYFFFVKPFHRLIVPMTLRPKFNRLELDVSSDDN